VIASITRGRASRRISDDQHVAATSGDLLGAKFHTGGFRYKQVGLTCVGGSSSGCARVQLTSGGASTSSAADGVVVRWRMQAPAAGVYHIVILEPTGGGSYKYARVSDAVTIGTDEALRTFPARLSIEAGGYVGFVPPPAASPTTSEPNPVGATFTTIDDSAVGSSTTSCPASPARSSTARTSSPTPTTTTIAT